MHVVVRSWAKGDSKPVSESDVLQSASRNRRARVVEHRLRVVEIYCVAVVKSCGTMSKALLHTPLPHCVQMYTSSS